MKGPAILIFTGSFLMASAWAVAIGHYWPLMLVAGADLFAAGIASTLTRVVEERINLQAETKEG